MLQINGGVQNNELTTQRANVVGASFTLQAQATPPIVALATPPIVPLPTTRPATVRQNVQQSPSPDQISSNTSHDETPTPQPGPSGAPSNISIPERAPEEEVIASNDETDRDSPPSGDSGDDGDENNYATLFRSFSEKWLNTQLTHYVSLTATNAFWRLALEFIPPVMETRKKESIHRKIPQFVQVRRNLYKEIAPKIKMSFAFLNKENGTIVKVAEDHTPLSKFQRDPHYQKLYEEAHIEVIKYLIV